MRRVFKAKIGTDLVPNVSPPAVVERVLIHRLLKVPAAIRLIWSEAGHPCRLFRRPVLQRQGCDLRFLLRIKFWKLPKLAVWREGSRSRVFVVLLLLGCAVVQRSICCFRRLSSSRLQMKKCTVQQLCRRVRHVIAGLSPAAAHRPFDRCRYRTLPS